MANKKIPELNAIVVQKQELTPTLMILRVAAQDWELPDFTPGQFAVLGLTSAAPRTRIAVNEPFPHDPDEMIRRAYSIASSSLIHEYMDFYIGLISSGALTPRLFALDVGEKLWLSKRVAGIFTLAQVPRKKNVVLIATGTGLAPYMSMLSTELTCDSSRRFAVLHGAYHSWDLGYRSELMTLQHLCHNLTYVATIDRPEQEPIPWTGETGWVQNLWERGVIAKSWGFEPTPENTDIFLCGNPNMIEDMLQRLVKKGFQETSRDTPGEVHIERF